MIEIDNTGAFVMDTTLKLSENLMRAEDSLSLASYVILHPVQLIAAQNALPIKEVLKAPKGDWESYSTMMGVRVIEDLHFMKDVIEIRDRNHNALLRIKNLAVPADGIQ